MNHEQWKMHININKGDGSYCSQAKKGTKKPSPLFLFYSSLKERARTTQNMGATMQTEKEKNAWTA